MIKPIIDNVFVQDSPLIETLEKYIDHVHTIDGVPLKVPTDLQNEIKNLFKNMIGLKKRGTNLFFTDIDYIENLMLEELKNLN